MCDYTCITHLGHMSVFDVFDTALACRLHIERSLSNSVSKTGLRHETFFFFYFLATHNFDTVIFVGLVRKATEGCLHKKADRREI